jgi:hypothetical protein
VEKKKTDIDLPFFKIKEDEEGSFVKVGPIEVKERKGEEDKVKIGPLHISDEGMKVERSLNSKLEGIAWALFLILLGCVWTFESIYDTELPGVVAMGIGVIWLGLNYTRHRLDIKTSTFTIILGILAFVYGAAEWVVTDISPLAVVAIAIGAYVIIKSVKG